MCCKHLRALRYWCERPDDLITPLAQRLCPQADAFQLNDINFFPIKRLPPGT